MKRIILTVAGLATLALTLTQCNCPADPKTEEVKQDTLKPTAVVNDRLNSFANVNLTSDISHLSDNQKKMLPLLFQVADLMNEIYWQQAYTEDKDVFLSKIFDEKAKAFAIINYGPWDRLNGNQSFFEGIGEKPAGANFYPLDMTKEEFEAFNDSNKTSLYTLIRRDEQGKLRTVWYHDAYAEKVQKAANLMKQAAELAEDEGFKKYLIARAEALLTDDYYSSDLAWMEMRSNIIDFVVGPIENYEDALYGYKAANESFILLKDIDWSKKLSKFSAMLPDLQAKLPIEEEYKKEVPGADADMNAYDVVYYAGDCNAGSKTIAINLPNDERIHTMMGSRKLQLKNAMKAKFDKILVPISEIVITPEQRQHIKFTAFFENTMFHEVGHAMGIKKTLDGTQTAREALKEVYSSLEEGKADIMGLWLVTQLYEMGELTEGEVMDNYVTFMAGIFRSVRFGAASSHGKANAMRYYYFKERGAFTINEDGTYTVNFEKMKEASIAIMLDILHIQGDGNYDKAKTWVEKDGIVTEDFQKVLDKINSAGIPVDVTYTQGPKQLGL
ncbi:MAG: Zn-dependent hydrolase [Bacteroidales bacterium]|nr:Zn-dependent hydrolase [Bacteroidales bacterium]